MYHSALRSCACAPRRTFAGGSTKHADLPVEEKVRPAEAHVPNCTARRAQCGLSVCLRPLMRPAEALGARLPMPSCAGVVSFPVTRKVRPAEAHAPNCTARRAQCGLNVCPRPLMRPAEALGARLPLPSCTGVVSMLGPERPEPRRRAARFRKHAARRPAEMPSRATQATHGRAVQPSHANRVRLRMHDGRTGMATLGHEDRANVRTGDALGESLIVLAQARLGG